jgi:hypothetical protein
MLSRLLFISVPLNGAAVYLTAACHSALCTMLHLHRIGCAWHVTIVLHGAAAHTCLTLCINSHSFCVGLSPLQADHKYVAVCWHSLHVTCICWPLRALGLTRCECLRELPLCWGRDLPRLTGTSSGLQGRAKLLL